MTWDKDQQFEADWWGSCVNTYGEETKQLTYAHRMGLKIVPDGGHWPVYDMEGRSVVDLGGGPASMLLKCKNVKGAVVDPCPYPEWVRSRYEVVGIGYMRAPAENFYGLHATERYDEAWIYNVLQHVKDPAKIVANARACTRLVRIFEWIDFPPHLGHPHELKEHKLNEWLGGVGRTEQMNENGCHGRAYYGVFKQ